MLIGCISRILVIISDLDLWSQSWNWWHQSADVCCLWHSLLTVVRVRRCS